jgi:hypothetical protein
VRLAWSRQEQAVEACLPDRCVLDGRPANGDVCCRCRHRAGRFAGRGAEQAWGPRIGPRVRLWQARDVPEAVVLELLRRRPGTWWAIDNPRGGGPGGASMPGMVQHAPELAESPWAVINAKLTSMHRRGLVDGCSCGCRGDWHVYGEDERRYWEWVSKARPKT